MTTADFTLLAIAGVLIVFAAILASAEAALSSISRVRAEELIRDGRRGAQRLLAVVSDAPRFVNTTLLVRVLCETTAIVLVTLVIVDSGHGSTRARGSARADLAAGARGGRRDDDRFLHRRWRGPSYDRSAALRAGGADGRRTGHWAHRGARAGCRSC